MFLAWFVNVIDQFKELFIFKLSFCFTVYDFVSFIIAFFLLVLGLFCSFFFPKVILIQFQKKMSRDSGLENMTVRGLVFLETQGKEITRNGVNNNFLDFLLASKSIYLLPKTCSKSQLNSFYLLLAGTV